MSNPGNIGSTKAITSHQLHQPESPKAKKGRLGIHTLFPVKGNQIVKLAPKIRHHTPKITLLAERKITPQAAVKSHIPRSNTSAQNKQTAQQSQKQDTKAASTPRAKASKPPSEVASPSAEKTSAQKIDSFRKLPVNAKTDAMRKLEDDNLARRERQAKEIENLPEPPKGIQKSAKTQYKPTSSSSMTGAEKAPLLPKTTSALYRYIGKISTTKELVETWNGITHQAIKGFISGGDLSFLKDKFANQLRIVAGDPDQAELITEKMVNTMVKGKGKQTKIWREIVDKQRGQIDIQNRLDNLRKR